MGSSVTGRLLALAPRARARVKLLVVLSLVITATFVGQGILVARVLAVLFGGGTVGSVVPHVGGIAGLMFARGIVLAWREAAAFDAASLVKEATRQRLVAKLFELGPGWLQRARTGDVQSTLVDGVETLDAYIGRYVPQAVAAVIGATVVTAYVIVLDPLVGSIILACGVLVPIVPVLSRRVLDTRNKPWWGAYKGLHSENLDALQGMVTLKAFNASGRRGDDLARRSEAFCRDSIRLMFVVIAYVGVVGLLVGIGTAFAVGIGSLRRAGGDVTTLELLTILLLTRECFRPLHDLQNAFHAAYSARPACTAIFELLDARPEVAGLADASERHHGVAAPAAAGPPRLVFDDVTFAYRERAEPALDRFTLDIAPGERVAVVGRSGAGKTTIVSLLLRFFELEGGRITLAGHDIAGLPLEELRAQVAVVSQDTYLFHETVRHNLALGRAGASAAELEAAARSAQAHDFIAALPDGYETVIGERGLKLSGGERQRIAIARALLKDAPVLVLDEATSSVDAANEAAIHEALDTLTRGRTTLVIAHRLSTVRNADRIVVLDAGQVVEVGAHDALVTVRGAYARLVAAQGGA